MKKTVSDSYLQQLWRKAVLIKHGNMCAYCGNTENLECHHIIKRRHKLTRWDWRNGIPGCIEHHKFYHTKAGEMWISENHQHYDELLKLENIIFSQYKIDNGITENEFRNNIAAELKNIINENNK